MVNFHISDKFLDSVDTAALEKAALVTLAIQNISEDVNLSVVIEDEQQLQSLNHEFLGIDSPTDVLSFFEDELDPETGQRYLGEVIISYPQAEKQGVTAGHSTRSELDLLVVHGVLHLLGYDHSTDKEKEKMWQIQKKILLKLGTTIKKYPE
ncbi:MAG: rRNA maturation RNase YbeY [Anaerolineaceae bacterium]|jgi:probable rRNA maturation factor